MKRLFAHTPESGKPRFSIAPEAFNSIDMAYALDKFIPSMIDSKMFFIPKINKPVIPSPPIRVNNAFKIHTTSNYRLQRGSSAIWDDFSINLPVTFEDAKNDSFTESSPASFAFDTSSAKEAFINFNLSGKRRLPLSKLSNSFSNFSEIPIDSIPVQAGNFCYLTGIQIQ